MSRMWAVWLLALAPTAALPACAGTREVRSETVVAHRPAILRVDRDPAPQQTDASALVVGSDVVIRAVRIVGCKQYLGEELLVETRVKRRPEPVVTTLEAAVAAAGAILLLAEELDPPKCHREVEPAPLGCQMEPTIYGGLGVLIAVPFGIAAVVDATAGGETKTVRTAPGPVLAVDHAPCASSPASKARAVLALRDGRSLSATLDTVGEATVPIDDSLWAGGESLEADLSIDGAVVRHVVMRRSGLGPRNFMIPGGG